MLHPSVVERVSATASGGDADQPRRSPRAPGAQSPRTSLPVRGARSGPSSSSRPALQLTRLDRRAAEAGRRSRCSGRRPLEDGQLGTDGVEVHGRIISASSGAWSESSRSPSRRRSSGQASGRRTSSRPRTRIWSIPWSGGENPAARDPQAGATRGREVQVSAERRSARRADANAPRRRRTRSSSRSAARLSAGDVRCRFATTTAPSPGRRERAGRRADSGAQSRRRHRRQAVLPGFAPAEPARGFSSSVSSPPTREPTGDESRVRLAGQRGAERAGARSVRRRANGPPSGGMARPRRPLRHSSRSRRGSDQTGTSCRQTTCRVAGRDEPDRRLDVDMPRLGERAAVEDVPGAHEQSHRAAYSRPVRARPPPRSGRLHAPVRPPPRHRARGARGSSVELVTSPLSLRRRPRAGGYARRELFYPASSRLFRPLAAPAAAQGRRARRRPRSPAPHPARRSPRAVGAAPPARPSACCARRPVRSSPRTTSFRGELRRKRRPLAPALRRASRAVVVHSERGRDRLVEEVGVAAGADRRSSRTLCSPVPRATRTTAPRSSSSGRSRPYKQLDHAIEVARGARCAAPRRRRPDFDLGARLRLPGVEWRLGYRTDTEIDDALAETTVALFPYREELDQSGALLRALGAGVAVRRLRRRRNRRAGSPLRRGPPWRRRTTSLRSRRPSAGLLRDPAALERARAGAREAGAELTWDAAAAAHLALYEELLS